MCAGRAIAHYIWVHLGDAEAPLFFFEGRSIHLENIKPISLYTPHNAHIHLGACIKLSTYTRLPAQKYLILIKSLWRGWREGYLCWLREAWLLLAKSGALRALCKCQSTYLCTNKLSSSDFLYPLPININWELAEVCCWYFACCRVAGTSMAGPRPKSRLLSNWMAKVFKIILSFFSCMQNGTGAYLTVHRK